MISCGHCGGLAPTAARFCPARGEAFDGEAQGVEATDAESMLVTEQSEAIGVEDSTAGDVGKVPLTTGEAISKGKFGLLYVNAALLCILVGLITSIIVVPPVRADHVPVTPTATATVFATDTPVESTPTRSAAPTPTTAASRMIPTATLPAPKPAPTAIPIPTATFAPPPPPSPPTPTPTPTLK